MSRLEKQKITNILQNKIMVITINSSIQCIKNLAVLPSTTFFGIIKVQGFSKSDLHLKISFKCVFYSGCSLYLQPNLLLYIKKKIYRSVPKDLLIGTVHW